MSVSSSNKAMCVDRLSALPDDILCYILSFLEMKEASITCLLSKRWQFLWTKLPGLRFKRVVHYLGGEEARKFIDRVNRTLAICSRHNLERFEVNSMYSYDQRFASDVNVWIGFAIEKKVYKFSLQLGHTWGRYTLPVMMFSNPSWTSLALRGLIMAPPGTIEWPSLTTLYIEDVLEKIFSGCPVLTSLDLVLCRGFRRLVVNSPSLHRLAIKDAESGGYLEISAPYLRTFKIDWKIKYKRLCLENIKSLVRAEITVTYVYDGSKLDNTIITQVFESIHHVKMLKLEASFMEVLSSIAKNLQLPQSMRGCLELHADSRKKSIPAIVGLLESSPNLETLVIHGYKSENWVDVSGIPALEDYLDYNFFHLKIVRFKNFRQRDLEAPNEMMLSLARILLKRAIVLEKMEFGFEEINAYSSTIAFSRRMQKVLNYPRVSQKALVLFSY